MSKILWKPENEEEILWNGSEGEKHHPLVMNGSHLWMVCKKNGGSRFAIF